MTQSIENPNRPELAPFGSIGTERLFQTLPQRAPGLSCVSRVFIE
jgi:hypothetical protein